jgi:hypothetical protein
VPAAAPVRAEPERVLAPGPAPVPDWAEAAVEVEVEVEVAPHWTTAAEAVVERWTAAEAAHAAAL